MWVKLANVLISLLDFTALLSSRTLDYSVHNNNIGLSIWWLSTAYEISSMYILLPEGIITNFLVKSTCILPHMILVWVGSLGSYSRYCHTIYSCTFPTYPQKPPWETPLHNSGSVTSPLGFVVTLLYWIFAEQPHLMCPVPHERPDTSLSPS